MWRETIEQGWRTVAWTAGGLAGSILLGLAAYRVALRLVTRWAARTRQVLDDAIVRHCAGPLRLLAPLLALNIVVPRLWIPTGLHVPLRQACHLGFVVALAWLLVRILRVVEDVLLGRLDVSAKDNLEARKVLTQTHVIRKILAALVVVLALGLGLMTFEQVRKVGVSILASAGIVGVIVGFAAQRTIATLLAGVQIALTQPIRLDDVVIVENEWGWIEEITLTYVVVRIWDLRRLIVPITYFLEKPFQNWTRTSSDILGTVFLYADYTVPIATVRQELDRIVRESEVWDGKVVGLQVTGTNERTMELRALVSAGDSSAAWNLRCEVREKLIDFLQRNHPESLPKVRAEVREDGGHPHVP